MPLFTIRRRGEAGRESAPASVAARGRVVRSQKSANLRGDLRPRGTGRPQKLAKQVRFLDTHRDYALVFHNVLVMFEDGSRNPYLWNDLPPGNDSA